MLSAFTARPLLELKQRDKSKIESVLLQGDRLFTGLSTGSLRIYRINESASPKGDSSRPSTANQKPADLLREVEKFSKYAITQLALVKEANALISLSNYQVSLHDLASYELQETLTKSKGATTLAVISHTVPDESTQVLEIVSRLAVAVKKKLLVWQWRDSALSSEEQEINLPATIRSVAWISGTLAVLGLSSHYVLVDIETSKVTDLTGPGAIGGPGTQESSRFAGVGMSSLMGGMGPMPLATRLGEGEILLSKDINTHFVDLDGKAIGRRQVPWAQAPDSIGYSYPYLLALNVSKGTVEVRNPETLTVLQTVNVPSAKILHVPNPGVSLAHAGKGFVVASDRSVWKMHTLSYDAQVDALVDASLWDEALSLLGMLEGALLSDKIGRIEEVKMLKAEDLFKNKKFRQSLELFTDVHAAPSRVIRLFPAAISGDESLSEEPSSTQSEVDEKKDENGDADADDAKSMGTKAETTSIVGSIRDSLKGSQINSGPKRETQLEGKELKTAVVELISFLVDTRTRIQRVLDFDGSLKGATSFEGLSQENKTLVRHLEEDPEDDEHQDIVLDRLRQVAKLVDSTLFRCYMFARPQLAGPLFRLPNFIDAEVADEKLLDSKRYSDLVDFFYGKGLHERALEVLTKLGKGEFKDQDVPESLRGPQRIVTYLQTLPASLIDLILRFVDWPMHTDPEMAMEVFTGDGSNAETLPRRQVLEYLQGVSPIRAAQYLEYIIDEFDEKTPEIHHRLIEFYLQSLQSSEPSSKEREDQREKLLSFVRSSRHYEPWRVVPLLRKDSSDLHEARAIVLGRMDQHKQALEIYVFDMNDISKAEDYCNEVWLDQQARSVSRPQSPTRSRPGSSHAKNPASPAGADGEKQTPYLILLSLLLSPRSPRKAQLAPALDLLARHGARLPAASTLNLIPEHISVADVEAYFKARIRASTATANMARIAAGLRKTVDDNADAALRLGDKGTEGVKGAGMGRNRSAVVYDDSICKVCRKRFGGSAIKVLPGGEEVVHYGCAAR